MRIAALRTGRKARRTEPTRLRRLLYRTRAPAEAVLTAALRRVARTRPAAFERLGDMRRATIRVAPTDFPAAFDLYPDGEAGRVEVARPGAPVAVAARITGPLLTLLALFDGRGDADGAFFQRRIQVEGDTSAVLALHNALEASELTLADILGLPPAFQPALERARALAERWGAGARR